MTARMLAAALLVALLGGCDALDPMPPDLIEGRVTMKRKELCASSVVATGDQVGREVLVDTGKGYTLWFDRDKFMAAKGECAALWDKR